MKKSEKPFLLLLLIIGIFSSCSPKYLEVTGIAYQSIRSKTPITENDIPKNSTIIVCCLVDEYGGLDVIIKNNSEKIMTIDRTKSFFTNQSGNSIPYYDPTVRVQSQSTTVGGQTGASVNLGSVASAAGVGGILGTALNGISVGGSQGSATTNTNTTYVVDQPQISISPHGQTSLGRIFTIGGVGIHFLKQAIDGAQTDVYNTFTPSQTYAACNLCVCYSIDDGKTFETILTDLYANTLLVSKVKQTGKINDALRWIYMNKNDALAEPWYTLYFKSNYDDKNKKTKKTEFLNYK